MTDVADIQITASLIDDYLQLENAPVANNLPGRFLAVEDPATQQPACLLTIDPSGNLLQFLPDSSSNSGWSTTSVPVPPPQSAIGPIKYLAGFSQAGIINALAYFPVSEAGWCAVWMQSSQPGSWTQASLTNNAANALGCTFQTDYYVDANGNQFLYGVTGDISAPEFFIVGFDPTQNAWDVFYEQLLDQFSPPAFPAATFQMLPGSGSNQFTIVWVDQGFVDAIYFQGASISGGTFTWAPGGPQSFNPGLGQGTTFYDFIPLPGSVAQGNLLIIGNGTTLFLCQGYAGPSPTSIQLTGLPGQPAGAIQAAAGVNASGMLAVFVVESSTQALWILRQTDALGTQSPFAAWVPLGNTLDALACPLVTTGGPELFMVDLTQTVYHMAQTPTDLVWVTSEVAAPTPSTATPLNIAATTMELTAVDANQTPVGRAVVSVSSDQPTTIIAADLSYPIAPGSPVALQADQTGRLTVSMQTTSLAAPVLTFSCTNPDGTSAQRWCQGDVVQVKAGDPQIPPCPQSVAQRLSGNDPTLPITQTTLLSAKLISPTYDDPSGAIRSITSAGQWLQQNGQQPANSLDLSRLTTPHWRIDFTDPAGPRFEALTAEQGHQLLAESRARRAAQPASGSGGWLSDILGDVLNYFKQVYQELESIAATVENGVLNIIINGETFIVQTVRQAASALEAIFNGIAQGLQDVYNAILSVVNFLKQLFEWGDILQTHLVIKWSINQFVSQMIDSVGDAQAWIDSQIGGLQGDITNAFTNLENVFQANQSFNGYVNAAGPNPIGGSGNSLAAQSAMTGYAQNGPRCNYVYSKAKTSFSSSTALSALCAGSMDASQDILTAVQNNWAGSSFNTNTQTFQTYFTNAGNPNALFDLLIVGFLTACQDLINFVLQALQDIVDAVLEASADALQSLSNGWNAPIDIPVVSWLYSNVITGTVENPGPALTILDVFSLILAIPATILYKLLHGEGNPPFDASQVSTITSGSIPWPAFPSASATARPVSAAASIPASFTETMGVVAGMADFFGTFITMAADGLVFSESPVPGLETFVSVAYVIEGIVSQVGGAPWTVFGNPPSSWTSADGWTLALWVADCIPLAYDSVFINTTGGLARFTEELGPVLDTGVGFALTGLAIATLVEQNAQGSPYTDWDCASSLLPQIQPLFEFLLLSPDDPVAMATLLIADLVLGVGSTVTQIGDAVYG